MDRQDHFHEHAMDLLMAERQAYWYEQTRPMADHDRPPREQLDAELLERAKEAYRDQTS
jgi:hypothetical protein